MPPPCKDERSLHPGRNYSKPQPRQKLTEMQEKLKSFSVEGLTYSLEVEKLSQKGKPEELGF